MAKGSKIAREREPLATSDDVTRILGTLDTEKAMEIMALRPSIPDVEEASLWLAGDTDIAYNVGGGRSLSMRDAATIVAEQYEALTGTPAPIDLPAGSETAPAEPGVDYRFERIAALGYRPTGDLAAEVRDTLALLGVGAG